MSCLIDGRYDYRQKPGRCCLGATWGFEGWESAGGNPDRSGAQADREARGDSEMEEEIHGETLTMLERSSILPTWD